MNGKLFALGILIIVGMFVFGSVAVPASQRSQYTVTDGVCSSVIGQMIKALGSIIDVCKNAKTATGLLSLEPVVYLVGALFLIIGLFMAGGKKGKRAVREPVESSKTKEESEEESEEEEEDAEEEEEPEEEEPEEEEEDEEEETEETKKSNVKYCGNCGAKAKAGTKFCPKCGKKL